MKNMKRLDSNVTIITGGGKGIGFGLAQAFAEEGSNLVITGRTESRLLKAKELLEAQYGIEVLPVVADGADEEAIKCPAPALRPAADTPPACRTILPTATAPQNSRRIKSETASPPPDTPASAPWQSANGSCR